MNSLAIDTATTALGLCLGTDSGSGSGTGPQTRSVIYQIGLMHSEKLMPAVRALLQEANLSPRDLDLIICSTGPGSFTGIRIGLATAKGLADGCRRRCRLIGASTLDGLAYRYRYFPGLVAAVNPSLRKKYYAAVFREGKLEGNYLETTLPDLCSALETRRPILITGAAARELYDLMGGAGPQRFVDASGQPADPAGLLARGVANLEEPDSEPVPLYLRRSEAEITFFGE
jgi:tRNA threonylcarbamoyladenosine biosynthesis protein TsaB